MNHELRKWNPFADVGDIQSTQFPSFGMRGNGHSGLLEYEDWEPAVDIEEDDEQFKITADLPKVKKEDISVTIEDGILSIRGERTQEEEVENRTFHRIERFHGCYERSFLLPEHIDEERLDAKLEDGVLSITLPKTHLLEKKEEKVIAVA